ncbi:AMP-binding protein [Pendulispora brunnea]|uniref:AMP-binding protein n=1 Tax=Pendulispora brunnea TaxID=2905690 RepID=A0ABZ2KI03_9BACT
MHSFSPLTPTVFLERTGRVFANATAIRHDDGLVTYGNLLRRSRRLATVLREHGVRYGDCIGLMSDNGPQVIEANFGIPGAGGVVVSLNPWLPTDDIVKQLQMVASRILIVSRACLQRHGLEALSGGGSRRLIGFGATPDKDATCIDYEDAIASAADEIPLNDMVRSEMDPIVVNFTSGTTGLPKGVVMSHRGAYLHALGQVLMLGLTRQSRYLWTLPMFHVNGWGHIWSNAAVGAGQIMTEVPGPTEEEETRFASLLGEAGVTHLAGAPRLLRRIVSAGAAASALKGCIVVTGGAAPTRPLLKQLEALGATLIHQYGLNETFGPYVVCEEQWDWAHEDSESRAAFRARQGVAAIHAGTGLRVVDADGLDVPADGKTPGEVLMSGNTVALGYYNNPEATARSFVNGWFHSGDLAVVHPDGYLEIKDRIKDLIYVETDYGWENISSIEVENVLVQCPGVGDAALIGLQTDDAQEGARLIAVIEASSQPAPSLEALHDYCERHLPVHMRPSRFVLSSIPKTATGKTRKDLLVDRALREP